MIEEICQKMKNFFISQTNKEEGEGVSVVLEMNVRFMDNAREKTVNSDAVLVDIPINFSINLDLWKLNKYNKKSFNSNSNCIKNTENLVSLFVLWLFQGVRGTKEKTTRSKARKIEGKKVQIELLQPGRVCEEQNKNKLCSGLPKPSMLNLIKNI